MDGVLSRDYTFQVEMVYRTSKLGFPIVEVPIRFESRQAGSSKLDRGEVLTALFSVLRLRVCEVVGCSR